MGSEKYLYHLLISMAWQKQNTLSQKGKSDIELPNYDERVEKWFCQVYDLIIDHPPQFYVNAIFVHEDEHENAVSIFYRYYDRESNIEHRLWNTVINVCRP